MPDAAMIVTPTDPPPGRRPMFVSFLSAIGIIQGVVVILLGIFAIADRNDADLLRHINEVDALETYQLTSDHLMTIGIVGIVFGLLLIVLSVMLAGGSNFVRWLLVMISAGNAAVGLHSLVALHGEQQMSGSITLTMSVLLIWLLAAHKESEEFFGR